ncbi:MAG: nicotinate-nicotinamide nucleotide adenylyltransferase [Bacilli bacterium]|jgi:nicotinate-nucleotide adenylyltransferase|nr:nicotinate-nicotinamide nucleotide adenylyltransferase [Bacilli bacterium]
MQIIYGGSFNPPTIAHVKIAQFLLTKYPQAEFLFLPANNFYSKDNLKDFKIRLQMLEIVCAKLGNRPKISDFEINLDRFYGTDFTLNHFPDAFFVIGADNLLSIHTWLNFPNVVKNHKYIVIPRNQIDVNQVFEQNHELSTYRTQFTILSDFDEVYLSSSDYRKTKNPAHLLPEIAEFIAQNNLYKE